MKKKIVFTLFVVVFAISAAFALSQEMPKKDSTVEQAKKEIIEDVIAIEEGLSLLRGCVAGAKTAVELEECRKELKIKRFQEVQDKLSEMGMSREERRLKKGLGEY
ncbi:MAG: hypothetical protein L0Y62_04145 [Nitrospirae bacterium]|nr:hypothetical protein [Nitrospirota bacterium]